MTREQIARKKIKAAILARLKTEDVTADQVEEIEFLAARL